MGHVGEPVTMAIDWTDWEAALDAFEAEIARHRGEVEDRLRREPDRADPFPPLAFGFPRDLGPLPPELADRARAALTGAWELEVELEGLARAITGELRALRSATRRGAPLARAELVDQRL